MLHILRGGEIADSSCSDVEDFHGYRKWDRVEITEDEDDQCHVNIDISLWRKIVRKRRQKRKEYEQFVIDHHEDRIKQLLSRLHNISNSSTTGKPESSITTAQDMYPDESRYIVKEIEKSRRAVKRLEKYRRKTLDELAGTAVDIYPQRMMNTTTTRRTCGGSVSSASASSLSSSSCNNNTTGKVVAFEFELENTLRRFLSAAPSSNSADTVEMLGRNFQIFSKKSQSIMHKLCFEMAQKNRLEELKTAARQYWLVNTIRCLAEELRADPAAIAPKYLQELLPGEVEEESEEIDHGYPPSKNAAAPPPLPRPPPRSHLVRQQLEEEATRFVELMISAAAANSTTEEKKEEEECATSMTDINTTTKKWKAESTSTSSDCDICATCSNEEYFDSKNGKEEKGRHLDAREVFKTLPRNLQEALVAQDRHRFQQILLSMDSVQAMYHLERCIKSRIWVPAQEDAATSYLDLATHACSQG
mmetsp:Transcript_20389/g.32854  ORF Transcript_20389/g.32854 Transcript_20389/m.32854 type:complete len:475 (+) Transcript_20389:331-1755(+)